MTTKEKSLSVIRLYKCAFSEFGNQISELTKITDGQFESVKFALKEILSDREYEVILRCFGFQDGKCWPCEYISFQLGLADERVHQIKAKAIRKITANRAKLPCLFTSQDGEKKVSNLIFQLNILHEDLIFKSEAELRAQLHEFSNSPFTYSEKATTYLAGRNETDLARLGLKVPTYDCLSRVGITTIGDVIDYPREEWPKIKNITEKMLKEIERTMKAKGFTDFKIFEVEDFDFS
ncbi:MAG: DNA-directed RNA polymerase subunit alpha C-terminal domain-containing protein [Candidatus Saccharibacteria bacterium]|nr:DNA-directed RNA polymerase subunit alpha C-terminal domain-containing protein [Candidatus Saccharibacteria bacterium]